MKLLRGHKECKPLVVTWFEPSLRFLFEVVGTLQCRPHSHLFVPKERRGGGTNTCSPFDELLYPWLDGPTILFISGSCRFVSLSPFSSFPPRLYRLCTERKKTILVNKWSFRASTVEDTQAENCMGLRQQRHESVEREREREGKRILSCRDSSHLVLLLLSCLVSLVLSYFSRLLVTHHVLSCLFLSCLILIPVLPCRCLAL